MGILDWLGGLAIPTRDDQPNRTRLTPPENEGVWPPVPQGYGEPDGVWPPVPQGYGEPPAAPQRPAESRLPLLMKRGEEPENFAGRPFARYEALQADDSDNLFPELRKKIPTLNRALQQGPDRAFDALSAGWDAFIRPMSGYATGRAEVDPGYREAVYEPSMALGHPAGEKSPLAYRWVVNPLLQSASLLGRGLFYPSKLQDVPEYAKLGYEGYERTPENIKGWWQFIDPTDLAFPAAGKLLRTARVASKIPGSQMRHMSRFTEPLTQVGEDLLTPAQLGMKPNPKGIVSRATNLFRLTPESKAHEALTNAIDIVGNEMGMARSADEMAAIFDKWADPEAVKMAPEVVAHSKAGQTTTRLMEGMGGQGQSALELYKQGRAGWGRLQQAAGDTPLPEFIKKLRAGEIADPEMKKLYDSVKDIPMNEEHFMGTLLARLAKQGGERAADVYGIQHAGWFTQINNIAKTAQSYIFLGSSPMYPVQNVISNFSTAAVHGVLGLSPHPERFWDRIGYRPARAGAGIGQLGIDVMGRQGGALEYAEEAIRKASAPKNKALGKLQSFVDKGKDTPLTFFSRLSQGAEQLQGENAFVQGFKKAWRQLWPKSIPDMSPGLKAALDKYGLTREVMRQVRAGYSPEEIVNGIFKGRRSASAAMERLVERFPDQFSQTDLDLIQVNYADIIAETVDTADDPVAAVRKLIDDLMDKDSAISKHMLGEYQARDARVLQTNGLGGVIALMDDTSEEFANFFARRDRTIAGFFDAPVKGDYKAIQRLLETEYGNLVERIKQRDALIRNFLEQEGRDTKGILPDWDKLFSSLKKTRRQEDILRERLFNGAIDLDEFYDAKRALWDEYDDARFQEMLATRQRFLTSITGGEHADVIARAMQLEHDASLQDRALKTKAWDEIRVALTSQEKSKIHTWLETSRRQLWSGVRQEQKNLLNGLTVRVNRGGVVTEVPAVEARIPGAPPVQGPVRVADAVGEYIAEAIGQRELSSEQVRAMTDRINRQLLKQLGLSNWKQATQKHVDEILKRIEKRREDMAESLHKQATKAWKRATEMYKKKLAEIEGDLATCIPADLVRKHWDYKNHRLSRAKMPRSQRADWTGLTDDTPRAIQGEIELYDFSRWYGDQPWFRVEYDALESAPIGGSRDAMALENAIKRRLALMDEKKALRKPPKKPPKKLPVKWGAQVRPGREPRRYTDVKIPMPENPTEPWQMDSGAFMDWYIQQQEDILRRTHDSSIENMAAREALRDLEFDDWYDALEQAQLPYIEQAIAEGKPVPDRLRQEFDPLLKRKGAALPEGIENAADEVAPAVDEVAKVDVTAGDVKAPEAPSMVPLTTPPELPKELWKATPRYGSRFPEFDSDVDMALYIIAKTTTKSKSHDKYMAFLMEVFPNKSERDLIRMGEKVKESVKRAAKDVAEGDPFSVPDSGFWREGARRATPTAQQVTPTAESVAQPNVATAADVLTYEETPLFTTDLNDVMVEDVGRLARILPAIADEMRFSPAMRMDPQTAGALRQWLEKGVFPAISDTRLAAIKWGEYLRDQALLNYSHRFGYNQALGNFVPYEYWYTTSIGHWTKKFMTRPALLGIYARQRQRFHEVEDSEDYPSRLRGMMRFEVPFLPDWAGDVFIDPLSIGLPLENFLMGPQSLEWASEKQRVQESLDYAIKTGAAPEVIEELKRELEASPDRDAMDYMSTFFSPGLQWQLPHTLLTQGQEGVEPLLPASRFVRGATALAGVNEGKGIDVEGDIRRWANEHLGTNLPESDQWGTYRVERMLANMAADGTITADAAKRALIEHKGPAWELATARAAQEQGLKTLTPFRDSPYPVGEERQRELARDKASVKAVGGNVSEWYNQHPEYEARAALFDLPEARYRDYLTGAIYDLPKLDQRNLRAKYPTEMQAFYDGTASTEDLAKLADAIGIELPEMAAAKPGEPEPRFTGRPSFTSGPKVGRVTDAEAQKYALYTQEVENRFGKGINDMQAAYTRTKNEQGDAAAKEYLRLHPKLQQYWDFQDAFRLRDPSLAQKIWPDWDQLKTVVYDLSDLDRRNLKQRYPTEMQAFYDDTLTDEQRATLSGAVGLSGAGKKVERVTDQQARTYAAYLQEIEDRFGKDIYDVQSEYMKIKDNQGKSAAQNYLRQNPRLTQYWDFNDEFRAKNPDVAKIAWPDKVTAEKVEQQSEMMRRVAAIKRSSRIF